MSYTFDTEPEGESQEEVKARVPSRREDLQSWIGRLEDQLAKGEGDPEEIQRSLDKRRKELAGLDSSCFIATAVYGDINAPEVQTLREFRDNVLMESILGRGLVGLYYSGLGERAANLIKDYVPAVIPVVRKGLDLIVGSYRK